MFTLGRKIDFSYKTNTYILLIVVTAFISKGLISGDVISGLTLAGSAFVTWALAREVDPAHDYSAFVAVAIAVIFMLTNRSVQFLPLFWILMMCRAVSGITGKKLTWLDFLTLLALTVALALNQENSIYYLISVIAMALIWKTGDKNKWVIASGIIYLGLFIYQSFFANELTFHILVDATPLNYVSLILPILLIPLFRSLSKVPVQDDQGNPADSSRIFSSQLLFLLFIVLSALFTPVVLGNEFISLSVIVGVANYYLSKNLLLHRK